MEGNSTLYSEEFLSCPRCLKDYDMTTKLPVMMPCLHTFCETCISNLVISEGSGVSSPGKSTSMVTESEPVYENSQAHKAEIAPNESIRAMAELIRQHPPSSRFNLPGRSLSRKSQGGSISPASLPAGAPVSPSAEVPVTPSVTGLTSQIPKGMSIRCPVCHIDINTSGLQTNRYIVAHMNHVARLGRLKPPFTATSESSQEFWCTDCSCLSRASCRSHEIQPLQMWIEDARADKKELLNTLKEPLHERTSQIEKMESFVRTAFHALTKASRKLWLDRQALQEVAETLKTLQENDSTVETPVQQAHSLSEEMAQLGKLWSDIEEESKDGELSLFSHNNKLFISTQHPDQTIVVHMGEESTDYRNV